MFGKHSYIPPEEHVEKVGQQMRDETELDNLQDDIRRNLKGEPVVLPWRTGRALRSAGPDPSNPEGTPLTPLAALDLTATVPTAMADRLAAEFARAATVDRVSEGVLDHAEALAVPLVVQETQEEADARAALEQQQAECDKELRKEES